MNEELIDNIPSEFEKRMADNDRTLAEDDLIKDLSSKFDIKSQPEVIKNYYNHLKNPQPMQNKAVLNNGENTVPEFELIDLLTLGITYLIKLAKQGKKDYEQFRNDEPNIANNCQMNGINYVKNNRKDNIKEVSKGIGLFHDINDLKKKIEKGTGTSEIKNNLEEKQKQLSEMCKNNETLNSLINSDKPSCAIANGMFHVAIIASKINENGEKEFYLIDQGGRKVPGSGFPSDDELSKNGINITQVASTNPMCMATAHAGLQQIAVSGLDAYLDRYAGKVKNSQRENVRQENILKNFTANKNIGEQNLMISNIQEAGEQNFAKKTTNLNFSQSKPLQISFSSQLKQEETKNDSVLMIGGITETKANNIQSNINIANNNGKEKNIGIG